MGGWSRYRARDKFVTDDIFQVQKIGKRGKKCTNRPMSYPSGAIVCFCSTSSSFETLRCSVRKYLHSRRAQTYAKKRAPLSALGPFWRNTLTSSSVHLTPPPPFPHVRRSPQVIATRQTLETRPKRSIPIVGSELDGLVDWPVPVA